MTPERIAEIRARVQAATPGPWTIEYIGEDAPPFDHQYITGRILSKHHTYTGNSVDVPGRVNDPFTMTTRDAVFITHARQDIPDLLEALATERARAERAEAGRDRAVKARLDWQADYDREKRQLHAIIDDARQRAEAAEGREARLREAIKDQAERHREMARGSLWNGPHGACAACMLPYPCNVAKALTPIVAALSGTPEGE